MRIQKVLILLRPWPSPSFGGLNFVGMLFLESRFRHLNEEQQEPDGIGEDEYVIEE